MAESIVAIVGQWIGTILIEEANVLFEVADQIQVLQQELELMQQYLKDADTRQDEMGSGELRTLIRQIRKLAYDAEDEIDTYVIKVQAGAEQKQHGFWLMRLAWNLYHAPHSYATSKNVGVIMISVKRATERLNGYGMRRIPNKNPHHEGCSRRQQLLRSYSHDDHEYGECVVGLEKDIRKLVDILTSEGNTQVNVLSIVGMGGSGKTTLARKLYNHPFMKECFHCTAWVFISQEWRTEHVLFEIFRKVADPNDVAKLHLISSLEELVDKIRGILKEKSYLVVLDDVWRREALEEILPALPRGNANRGSKIIVTTRNRDIVQFQSLQQHLYIHESQPLSQNEAWELLSKLALSQRRNCCNLDSFEKLGKEMLKKCGGLPLAVATLAGILNRRESIGEWQLVSEAVRLRVMECTYTNMGKSVQDLLALSYDDLPYYLKPCLLYLGVFPEDCQIPVGMLIRMWIAEGLITAHHEDLSPEDVAIQYLEELSHRFMIQVARTNFMGAIKSITLHDLLRDLCLRIAKEEGFLQLYTAAKDRAPASPFPLATQPRRAALHSSFSFPKQDSKLRSLTLLTRSSILRSAYASKETIDLKIVHNNYKLLRVLNLWGITTNNGTLPKQIGSLLHLRYLGIRASNIIKLPKSIGKLRNLMTLDYRDISFSDGALVKIPNVLWKLTRLRHLFLPIECAWSMIELHLGTLQNLRILWGVRFDGGFTKQMPELSTTLKKLKIVVSTERDLEAAFSCPSLMSNCLQSFHCEWRHDEPLQHVNPIFTSNQSLNKLVVFGKIRLKKLSIIFPCNLVILELKDSLMLDEDPMVVAGALTHLKFLRLSNAYLGNELVCGISSFPLLEELFLECFPNLNLWMVHKGAMPCLKKLDIKKCGNLREFPQGLPFMATLQQLECFGVPEEFVQKAEECGWAKQRLRLPHNIEAIVEKCDAHVDISSIRKLYEQLTAGIMLSNKEQKYWVMKQNDRYYNCFKVYISSFCFLHHKWGLIEMQESSDGESITVLGVLEPSVTDVIGLYGEFNIEYLSPGVTYDINFEVMLLRAASEGHMEAAISKLYHHQIQEHELKDKPTAKWMRLFAGSFTTSSATTASTKEMVGFSLEGIKPGMVIRGVVIEPKLKDLG